MPFSDLNQIRLLLDQVADALVNEKGFIPSFSESNIAEIQTKLLKLQFHPCDLTHLFWISIDNLTSQDLDQITFAEQLDNGKYRLFVGISDVDETLPFNSAVDLIARNNTTTIYTPFKIYPMIPPNLCYDQTSLLQNQKRNAIVMKMIIEKDGRFKIEEILLATVENKAKLVYEQVAEWIEKKIPLPNITSTQDLVESQITLQNEIALKIHDFRKKNGALSFFTIQGEPFFEKGIPKGIQEKKQTVAHKIIENLMIATNVCVTQFFIKAKLPILRRVVKTPKRWNKIVEIANRFGYRLPDKPNSRSLQKFLIERKKIDPDHFPDLSLSIIKLIGRGEYIMAKPDDKSIGHFDLALVDYAHTTAPNRRYPDLMMQRLLKNYLLKSNLIFDFSLMSEIAINCTKKEESASKIERRLFKSFAAYILSSEIGRQFQAIVTGSSEEATWVRLKELPVEGKLIKGYESCDVGDSISVILSSVDIEKGFIDFLKQKEQQ